MTVFSMPKSLLPALDPHEPPAYSELRRHSTCPWFLAVDHASNRIPRTLGSLGLKPSELERHIAYDLGALGVATTLSAQLDAHLVWSEYSRLVIDCNRPVNVASLIPTHGDEGVIPGNLNLSAELREWRIATFWQPYHAHIAQRLDQRLAAQLPTYYIAIHSMTNQLGSQLRKMDGAVLFRPPSMLGLRLASYLRQHYQLTIAENEPYQLTNHTDYSVPVHAERRGLEYIELEMRQDLISDGAGQRLWANRLAQALQAIG